VSLKDQAGFVKEALSSDEKMLESAFKLEKLYKKHKYKLWTVIVLLVLFFGGKAALQAYREATLQSANAALLTLQTNPQDSAARATLKEKNPKLYELFVYAQAVAEGKKTELQPLGNSADALISDISRYHAAVLESKTADSVYYQELTLVEEAFTALKSGNKSLAKQKLELVGENSPLSSIARLLRHYTIEVN